MQILYAIIYFVQFEIGHIIISFLELPSLCMCCRCWYPHHHADTQLIPPYLVLHSHLPIQCQAILEPGSHNRTSQNQPLTFQGNQASPSSSP